jgi:ABC-type branched-subunit amino acid transport system substrate-binding protein
MPLPDPTGPLPTRRAVLRAALAGASAASLAPACAAPSSPPIVLGHPYPASGPMADLAIDMKGALDAAAAEINAQGGVRGRPLKLVSLDDAYEPQRCLAHARHLRTAEGAVALVAPVGSPSLALLMPWAEETRTPIIGARSGAENQRGYHRWTFFNAASSGDEVAYIGKHLATIRALRLGVMFVANSTGSDLWQRLSAAAQTLGLQPVRAESFAVDGKDAPRGVKAVLAQTPDAVVVAGGGDGAVQVVRQLLAAGLPAGRIYALSLLHPAQVHPALGAQADGMVFSQVMPAPDDPKLALCASYRRALQRVPGARASAPGLEAYLSMQIAVRALQQVDDPARGDALVDALERAGNLNAGGIRISFDKAQHRGTRFVELAILSGGKLRR